MRFKKLLALIIISTFLLTGCKNDKKYNEYMEEGQQAVKQEQYEDALDYFESALTEKDGDIEATSLHTQVEKILQVEAKIKNKLYDEAIELCNEIIKSDSESSVCRDVAQSLKSQCEKLKEEQENLTFKEEIDKKIDEAKKLMDKEEYMNAKVKLGYIIEEVTGKPSYTEELKECNSLLKTCNDKIDELANKKKKKRIIKQKIKTLIQIKLIIKITIVTRIITITATIIVVTIVKKLILTMSLKNKSQLQEKHM